MNSREFEVLQYLCYENYNKNNQNVCYVNRTDGNIKILWIAWPKNHKNKILIISGNKLNNFRYKFS